MQLMVQEICAIEIIQNLACDLLKPWQVFGSREQILLLSLTLFAIRNVFQGAKTVSVRDRTGDLLRVRQM